MSFSSIHFGSTVWMKNFDFEYSFLFNLLMIIFYLFSWLFPIALCVPPVESFWRGNTTQCCCGWRIQPQHSKGSERRRVWKKTESCGWLCLLQRVRAMQFIYCSQLHQSLTSVLHVWWMFPLWFEQYESWDIHLKCWLTHWKLSDVYAGCVIMLWVMPQH